MANDTRMGWGLWLIGVAIYALTEGELGAFIGGSLVGAGLVCILWRVGE